MASLNILAQTGPGGVGSSTTVAIWCDADNEGFSNGNVAGTIQDFSGNNNDFTGISGPTYISNALNGRSVFRFSGSQSLQVTSTSNMNNPSSLSWFSVANHTGAGTWQTLYSIDYTENNNKFIIHFANGRFRSALKRDAGNLLAHQSGVTTSFQIINSTWQSTSTSFTTWVNNTQVGNTSSTGAVNMSSAGKSILGKNTNNSGGLYSGDLAELIIFNSAVNATQKNIINNYLAAKYGLSISSDLYSHQATHPNEVAGIGQTSASDNHTVAQGTSVVRIQGATSLNDGDFLLWGHDGAALSGTTSELPASFGGNGSKLTREWVADISNGNVGTVTLSFDLDGYSLGADPSEYRLLIDSDGDFTNATVVGSPSGSTTITFTGVDLYTDGPYFTLANSGNVTECVSFFTPSALWTASPGSTWDCGTTPDSTSNVTVDVGFTRTVTGTQSCNDLTIDGTLVINSGATLIVKGNMTVTGTVTCDPGSNIIFRGTGGLQFVDNSSGGTITFHDIETNNTNNVRFFGGNYAVSGGITLRNGEFQNTTSLTLTSDAANTGHIAMVTNGLFGGSGSYTVERFMSGRTADWNDITNSGVVGATIEDMDNEVYISGITGGDGSATTSGGGGGFISMWYFDNNTDVYVAPTNTSETMVLGRGYEMWLGDNLTTWNAKAWDLSGTSLNLSTTNIPVNSLGGGWNLIGNPFPAFLDFATINTNFPTISGNVFWYYDADSSQYNFRGPNAIVPPGQGLWLHMFSPQTISLDPTEVFRSDVNNSNLYKRAENRGLKIEVKGDQSIFGSAIHIWPDPNGYEGLDFMDIPSLKIPDSRAVNMWMDFAGEETMVNYIDPSVDHLEIPIVIESGIPGTFDLGFKGLAYFKDFQCMNLINEANGNVIKLSSGAQYQIEIGSDLQPLHFTLVLSKEDYEDCLAPTGIDESSLHMFAQGKSIVMDYNLKRSVIANVTVYNALGSMVYSSSDQVGYSRETIDLYNHESGMYMIAVEVNGQVFTQKVILQ